MKKRGFTLLEVIVALAIFTILAAISRPYFLKTRARGKQSEAKTELALIYGVESTFKAQFKTYHMNYIEMGYTPKWVIKTNISSTANTFLNRLYCTSAGGPIDSTVDDPKPVTFASLSLTVTRPDPTGYTGVVQPNTTSACNVTAATCYGASNGVTPTATATTLVVAAKGCPKDFGQWPLDAWSINQDGIISQQVDGNP